MGRTGGLSLSKERIICCHFSGAGESGPKRAKTKCVKRHTIIFFVPKKQWPPFHIKPLETPIWWHQITLQRSDDNYDGLQGCLLYEWTNSWTLSIIRARMLSAKSKGLEYFRKGISNSVIHLLLLSESRPTQACPMRNYIQLYKYSVQKSKANMYNRARHCYSDRPL